MNKLSPEELEQLKREIKEEMKRDVETEKRNKLVVRRVLDRHDKDFERFNWCESRAFCGKQRQWENTENWKVRQAVSTMIRATLMENRIMMIEECREDDVEAITAGIIKVCEPYLTDREKRTNP